MARGTVTQEIKIQYSLIIIFVLFLVYMFAAASPIPEEMILSKRWLSSFESSYPAVIEGASQEESGGTPLPFQLGERYGYIGDDGKFLINTVRKGYVSISEQYWAEYEPRPERIGVFNAQDGTALDIEKPRGYPLFLDQKIFLIGEEQNSVTLLDSKGKEVWSYVFSAPLTCVDAAGGFVLSGSLDGVVELLDPQGRPAILPFEPGGSRLSVILGCALSNDASRVALIAGIDDQRFLLLERSGDICKVIHHEFLNDGFRRPVHIAFIDGGSRVAYEREGGLGIYDINKRENLFIPLEGELVSLDGAGSGRLLFLVTSQGETRKTFMAIGLPGTVIIRAPFRSEHAFLSRRGSRIYLGGDLSLASFELGRK